MEEAFLNAVITVIGGFIIACMLIGAFEWARAKREERKLTQEAKQAATTQRKFWEKAGTESVINIHHKEKN